MIAPAADEALEPVRAAILRAADADARRQLHAAGERAAAVLAEARAEADRSLREARAAGAAEAAALAAAELAGARREARTVLLRARRERYEAVRARVLDRLRGAGLEPALRERIGRLLGPSATVAPSGDGGLVGTAADRAVDCSLTSLAEHAMTAAADRIEEVWS